MVAQHKDEVAKVTGAGERHEQTIRDLTSDREELVKGIATSFPESTSPALIDLIRDAVVHELEDRIKAAYHARNRAMAAIWKIDEIHNAAIDGRCTCGKPTNSCRDFNSIGFFRETYYAWERRQIDLMRQNKFHGLPADHPASLEFYTNSWSWKGEPSIDRDTRR